MNPLAVQVAEGGHKICPPCAPDKRSGQVWVQRETQVTALAYLAPREQQRGPRVPGFSVHASGPGAGPCEDAQAPVKTLN